MDVSFIFSGWSIALNPSACLNNPESNGEKVLFTYRLGKPSFNDTLDYSFMAAYYVFGIYWLGGSQHKSKATPHERKLGAGAPSIADTGWRMPRD